MDQAFTSAESETAHPCEAVFAGELGTDGERGVVMARFGETAVGDGDLKTYTLEHIVDVTVRGRSGVWLPDTPSPDDDNALVWEENGISRNR